MTEKYILSNGGVKDTVQGITFDSFSELLVVLNGQSRHLQKLSDENEQLREHFIYLIGTALEDRECRKIYAKGLLEIFDDCANLDEAKTKIKEYLE